MILFIQDVVVEMGELWIQGADLRYTWEMGFGVQKQQSFSWPPDSTDPNFPHPAAESALLLQLPFKEKQLCCYCVNSPWKICFMHLPQESGKVEPSGLLVSSIIMTLDWAKTEIELGRAYLFISAIFPVLHMISPWIINLPHSPCIGFILNLRS